MSPPAKRNAVNHLVAERDYSQMRACQLVGISRSSERYQQDPKPEEMALRQQVRQLAYQHPGYGNRLMAVILKREGSAVNHKRIQRIWQAEGLQLPRRKPRKRRCGPRGAIVHKAQYRNHVWSYDFHKEHSVAYCPRTRIISKLILRGLHHHYRCTPRLNQNRLLFWV